jgi:hypothetical protein
MIGIAVVCQVALLISYAASWGLCVPLLVEAIATLVYITLSVAEVAVGWTLYDNVCNLRNKIQEMLESDDYAELKELFEKLCGTNPNRLNDWQSIVGWVKLSGSTIKFFITFFNNNLFAFQGKLAQPGWYPPKWVAPASTVAMIILAVSLLAKIVIEWLYFRHIFKTDISKISELHNLLTT